jgi:hypothetical protein
MRTRTTISRRTETPEGGWGGREVNQVKYFLVPTLISTAAGAGSGQS